MYFSYLVCFGVALVLFFCLFVSTKNILVVCTKITILVTFLLLYMYTVYREFFFSCFFIK